jgi:hypothetical protein
MIDQLDGLRGDDDKAGNSIRAISCVGATQ